MLRPPDAELLYDAEWRRLVVPCQECHGTGKRSIPAADPMDPDRKIVRCRCLVEVAARCRLAEGNVPEEFWGVETWKIEQNEENFETVKTYCLDLASARANGRGFVFCGENGTGKTSFACYILASAVKAGYSVGYLTSQEYLSTIIPSGRDMELAAWFRAVQVADFFVLDELGKENRKVGTEDESSFWLASLDSLIRQRVQNLRPTVLISNMTAARVGAVYGASFASVLTHRVEYLTFDTGDFRTELHRRRRKEQGKAK